MRELFTVLCLCCVRGGVESSKKIVSDENWKLNNTANKHFGFGFSNLHIVSSYIFDFFIVFIFCFCFFFLILLLSSENYFRVFFCFSLRLIVSFLFFLCYFSFSYPINCYLRYQLRMIAIVLRYKRSQCIEGIILDLISLVLISFAAMRAASIQ